MRLVASWDHLGKLLACPTRLVNFCYGSLRVLDLGFIPIAQKSTMKYRRLIFLPKKRPKNNNCRDVLTREGYKSVAESDYAETKALVAN